MILKNIALLASDTARTKAYLQMMIKAEKLPGFCIVYAEDMVKLEQEEINYVDRFFEETYFSKDIPLLSLIKKAGIDYVLVQDKDINSPELVNCIKEVPQKYLIYFGYGGYILKPHLFTLGKKYIHVHADLLPEYRGSTTAYYSYLQEGILGASAIFLSEEIDEGEVISRESFDIPEDDVNIDYIYEPWIRAKVLLKAIASYLEKGSFESEIQQNNPETYFIIHPVLKHLALLKMEAVRGN